MQPVQVWIADLLEMMLSNLKSRGRGVGSAPVSSEMEVVGLAPEREYLLNANAEFPCGDHCTKHGFPFILFR